MEYLEIEKIVNLYLEKERLSKQGTDFMNGDSFEFGMILKLEGLKDVKSQVFEVVKKRVEEINRELKSL